jgi:hypothetical protein
MIKMKIFIWERVLQCSGNYHSEASVTVIAIEDLKGNRMKEEYLKEIKKIDKQISKLYSKQNSIKLELLKYRISTGDYIDGDDLINLPNYTRIDVDVVLDSNFEEVYIPSDEGVYIQDGRLDCSSYNEGLLYYSDDNKCYIYSYYHRNHKLDIKYIFLKED